MANCDYRTVDVSHHSKVRKNLFVSQSERQFLSFLLWLSGTHSDIRSYRAPVVNWIWKKWLLCLLADFSAISLYMPCMPYDTVRQHTYSTKAGSEHTLCVCSASLPASHEWTYSLPRARPVRRRWCITKCTCIVSVCVRSIAEAYAIVCVRTPLDSTYRHRTHTMYMYKYIRQVMS